VKYLDQFLNANEEPTLPSVPSVTFPKRIGISGEEEEDPKYITHRADRTDRSPQETDPSAKRALTELTEGVPVGPYVPGAEFCAWCGNTVGLLDADGRFVAAIARRTACGDLLHARCWTDSTRIPDVAQPLTPHLDAIIAAVERKAARRAIRESTPATGKPPEVA
jgi:hypothetical protein